ncbi:peptidyl-prolyl cis-trans isomerase, putative [Plasmodium knowlesi strain H]|uniref:Peptidyl-prolyl cis-trans isomerase n=3 Tax=Plasmodium knowlesi TaxID=5850 RepID=A0A5K1V9A4_PLAKH|nr:peptidyl-prolyl cis-trans isomerase, putative [Plasmodium knowlesi strain H]OTN64137.1 Peptidyl-prolyl cis-trans isomerase [Plasmodium knowlesi]CAA9990944.1 peptidyl-prolyl cis-trans isomerase, putative [Plasmodium knowlesi strain H]SBO20834.1 peptidyl-prolyl cis-trans isomerase, putative [Plasmodium knowlesi strain H]SBO21255.1 peptidyl-prolyl cis-trans isomerase, putative [Plasmodium knowlesi strain H]VVS80418.1 peptidyl-prolyl cis-trans isomerase, putative [Plasmodium knowlesi strain H]|eukprot:XP_002262228.1 cyclophilin, putative [Plasmodium knowlesi strain H]
MLKKGFTATKIIGKRCFQWWDNLNTSWKFAIGFSVLFPPLWNYNERRKAREKQVYYNKSIKDYVFFDIAIENKYVGRVLIGLYSDQVPLSVENFIQLAEGYKVKDKYIGYRNTFIHKIYPGIGLVGGNVLNDKEGLSIYGKKFPDENFDMEFVQDGDVALFNEGPHSNSSQFIITFSPMPILHKHNVVIGTVLKGMDIIRMIENVGTKLGNPMYNVKIINCGLYRSLEQDGPPFFNMLHISDKGNKNIISKKEFENLSEQQRQSLMEEIGKSEKQR